MKRFPNILYIPLEFEYDEKADAGYISLVEIRPGDSTRQEFIESGLILDFNQANELIGIEFLQVKGKLPSQLVSSTRGDTTKITIKK